LDGAVLQVNATALNGIDATLDAVIGKPFWETPWFAETPGMPETIHKSGAAAAADECVRMEIDLNLPVGSRSFDFAIRPIRDENGVVTGLIAEAADRTERRQAEEALRQRMEAVGHLSGGLAHDFNNLLTGVIGSLELLQRHLRRG